jgi:hypothetical protein
VSRPSISSDHSININTNTKHLQGGHSMSIARFAIRGALAAAALTIALFVLTAPTPSAEAANGRIGVRETVCAQSLYFRTEPHDGAYDGELVYGETFLVEGPKVGKYIRGFAYGDINRRGWVADGWFC